MNKIAITTLIAAIPVIGGSVQFYDRIVQDRDAEVVSQMVAGDVELDLQRVELELKLLRTIEERRELTADERDRLEYLQALREILLAEQRTQVG